MITNFKIFENTLNNNFWNWFKDSKVVDNQGSPLVVYHGTGKKFRTFNIKKTTQGIIWFTSNKTDVLNKEVGAAGHGVIMELYISLQNPAGWKEYEKYGLGQLKGLGYDGAILPEDDNFVGFVFESNQIKSVNNKGEFSIDSNNIYESVLNDNFKKWFDGSKVLDEHGNPLIVYHGTDTIFNEFDINKSTRWSKIGFWFCDDKDFGKHYGEINMPVYLSIKKPKIIPSSTFDDWRLRNHDNINFWINKKSKWISEGYDGLIIKGEKEVFAGVEMKNQDFYMAFEPNQIKSAEKNNGNYSIKSNNINESLNNNFWKWFGNSKTVDLKGNPKIFYHGTNRDFDKFRNDRLLFFTENKNYVTMYTNGSGAKGAHYISQDEKDLEEKTLAGKSVLPVYLKIEKPFDTRNIKDKKIFLNEFFQKYGFGSPLNPESGLPDWTDAEDLQEFFNEKGYDYDGLYIQDSHENITTVVFNPNQVKSAIGNNGNYSLTSDKISENKNDN